MSGGVVRPAAVVVGVLAVHVAHLQVVGVALLVRVVLAAVEHLAAALVPGDGRLGRAGDLALEGGRFVLQGHDVLERLHDLRGRRRCWDRERLLVSCICRRMISEAIF